MVEFVLNALNTQIDLTTRAAYPDEPSFVNIVASYTLSLNIPEDKLHNVFFFQNN